MQKMYPPVVNSPKTELAELVTDTQTEITVANASVLLQGEGIAVLGNGDVAETITYTSVEENVLKGCIRGFEGVARAWPVGTRVARNFTAYDHVAFKGNIEELGEEVAAATTVAAAAIPAVQKGAASGVATLDKDSKVPAAQLPISTATDNTSQTQIASASAVKAAYDSANSAYRNRGNVPSDWNSAILLGVYNVALGSWSGYTNYPDGAYGYGVLVVEVIPGAAIEQTYYSHENPGRIYNRISFAGLDWRVWTEVFKTSGGDVSGPINSTHEVPLVIKRPNEKTWVLHKSRSTGNVYISPSNSVGGADWNFGKGLIIGEDNIMWAGGDLNSLKSASISLYSGNGSPEGVVSAPIGSLYRRWDGGVNTTLYVKQSGSGNTGWAAK